MLLVNKQLTFRKQTADLLKPNSWHLQDVIKVIFDYFRRVSLCQMKKTICHPNPLKSTRYYQHPSSSPPNIIGNNPMPWDFVKWSSRILLRHILFFISISSEVILESATPIHPAHFCMIFFPLSFRIISNLKPERRSSTSYPWSLMCCTQLLALELQKNIAE